MKETKSKMGKIIGGIIALAVVIAAVIFLYVQFSPKAVAGEKAVTITVIDNEENSTQYDLQTDAEFLRQAMEEAEGLVFEGTESDYGMMVESVNGITADYAVDGAYWAFYVNGEYCNYGIDTQPVFDQDKFEIIYTKE